MADKHTDKTDKTAETKPNTMEVGGSGVLKVSFQDAMGADIKPVTVDWIGSNELALSADPEDPTAAKAFAVSPGSATIHATGTSASGGRATASLNVRILEKGAAVVGKIELTASPAPETKPAPAPEPAPHSNEHAKTQQHTTAHSTARHG
jgi:hypothetical protein